MTIPRWYVVRTTNRGEYLAASELKSDGYEVYLPLVQGNRKDVKPAYEPLFPGYLFLRCNPHTHGWPSFRQISHVYCLLKLGGEIVPVPDDLVIEIKERLEGMNQRGGIWRRYKPGDAVEITSEAMPTSGEVLEESKSPTSRVKVLLNFMGTLVKGEVPWQDLRPLENNVDRTTARAPRRTRGRKRWIHRVNPEPVPSR